MPWKLMIWGYPYFRKPANRPCQSWNQQGPCSTTNGRPVPFTFLVGYFNAAIMGSSEWQKTGTEFVQSAKPKNYGGTATKNYGGTACDRAISVGKERYIHICVCACTYLFIPHLKKMSWVCTYMLRQYEVYVCVYCTNIYKYTLQFICYYIVCRMCLM